MDLKDHDLVRRRWKETSLLSSTGGLRTWARTMIKVAYAPDSDIGDTPETRHSDGLQRPDSKPNAKVVVRHISDLSGVAFETDASV